MDRMNRPMSERHNSLSSIVPVLCIGFFLLAFHTLAQTPVTQYACDPRSTANGGTCPNNTTCTFPANVEKGCNCFDNVDNDGDGKFDQADPDCFAYFGLTFVSPGEDCSITPPGANTPFDLVGPPAVSGQNTADTQSKVAAGDVDGNGTPDAVITSKWNSEVRITATAVSNGLAKFGGGSFAPGDIIAGFDLDANIAKAKFNNPDNAPANLLFEHEVLIADIFHSGNKPDGAAEIFCVVSNRKGSPSSPPVGFYLLVLRLNQYGPGGLITLYDPVYLGVNRPGTFGIADMDGDGKAEIYLRDRVFAAETGKLLASPNSLLMTGAGTASWDINVSSAPVAVDIKSAPSAPNVLELVVGAQIYTIPNLTNRNPALPAALTLFRDMNTIVFDINGDGVPDQYFVKLMNDPAEYGIDTHASTSVADMDKDEHVDVVLTGAINTSNGRTAIFYWNVFDNTVTGMLTPNSAVMGYPNGPSPAEKSLYDNYLNGWIWGTGRVNIGDANADGNLDLSFIAGNQLFCISTNTATNRLYSVWTQNSVNLPSTGGLIPVGYRTINDTRSGVLTVTLYDFDNNGTTELVYRDSEELAIVDGATGVNKLFSRTCRSHTYTEGPIIADVNGDGNTDICVACNRSDNPAQFNINAGIQQQALGEIRMYFSSGEWLPTRRVWNQPGYFVVNINDDLTLPFPQFDIALQFAGECSTGPAGPRTPFNVFLNQVPFLSSTGCPIFPAPDLTFIGDDPNDPSIDPNNPDYFPKVFVESPICGNLDLKVGFNITNSGNIPISTSIPVSFFVGSPYDINNPGTLLHSTTININNLQLKDTLSIGDLLDSDGNLIRAGDQPFIEFDGPGTVFEMYVVLYNDGSVLPIDTLNKKQNGQVESTTECDITNNYWPILVVPKPFTVNIDSIDNVTCSLVMPPPPPYNGQLISHISVGSDTVIDLSPYRFRWYTSSDTTSSRIQGESNYNLQNIAGGDYYLVIDNIEKGCSSDPILGQVLNSTTAIVDFTVTATDQEACEPPDGSVQANITSGNAGYEITWEDENGAIVGSGPTLNNIRAGTYTARVRESATDCELFKDGLVAIGFALPEVQPFAEGVVNCLNPSSGKLTAIAYKSFDELGNPIPEDSTKYIFDWYFYDFPSSTRQSILPTSNGKPTITNVAIGYYEVLITEIATGCTEANTGSGIIEVQDETFLPEVFFTELAKQTSCDPLQPNGRLLAQAAENGVPDPDQSTYTFEWFEGQNTITPHLGGVSGNEGQIAENVKGGGQAYTVRITTANQCSVTRDTIVTEMIVFPQVALSTTPNSVCDQSLGFTGSVLSTVTFNGNSVTAPDASYSFKWYDGPTNDPANERGPDLNKQNLTAVDSGFYTLVVTNEVLHCPSVASVEQVMSIKALPVIATGSQASTNCAPAMPGNGSAFVSDVDNGQGTGAPYAFQWFDNTNTAIGGATQPVLGNVQGPADFTVRVRNNTSGCENTVPVQVADEHIIPLLSAIVVSDNICDANLTAPGITRAGAVNATIDNQGAAPIGDFNFSWVAEDGNINLGINAPGITQLDSGFYTLTVNNVVTGCVSNPMTRFVPTTTSFPIIDTQGTPSTNCLPAVTGNGRVEVIDVDGNGLAGQYVYQWYNTNDTTGTKINGATQPFINNIQGGNNIRFTVRVIDQSNGCASIAVEQVLDNHLEPVIQVTASPNDICNEQLTDPPALYTGSVSSTITNLGVSPLTASLSDYQFTWTDLENGAILKDKVTGGANGGEALLNRDSSDYSLVVIHGPTGCVSNLAVATVTLDVALPAIVTGTISSTNCLPGFEDGSGLITTIDGFAAPNANFIHQWYATQDTTGTKLPGQTNFNIVNRQGGATGYYTVLVTNLSDGCQNTATLQIPDNKTRPVITLGSTDNVQCEGLPNGTAFLESITYKGTTLTRPDPFTGFTFGWKSGQTTFEIINQAKDTYKLAVTSNVGCTSDTVSVDINNDLVFPNTVFTTIPQTSCVINTPNGEIFAAVDAPGNTAGYNYSWFTNTQATVALNPSKIEPGNPFHAITLPGNLFYTVMVQNSSTLCRDTATTFLQEILRIPTIALTAKDIVNCNDPGEVEALVRVDLNDDGVLDVIDMTQQANIDRYKLTWYRGTSNTDPTMAETSYLLTQLDNGDNLAVGNYASFVIDDITKCFSPVEFDFVNGPAPLFGIFHEANILPPSCGDPRGAITAFVTTGGPTVDPSRYSFEWYKGTPIDPSKTFYTDPRVDFLGDSLDVDAGNIAGTGVYLAGPLPGMQTPVSQKNGATLYGVESGTYSVVVRIVDATDPAFGCAEYHTAYLPFIDEPTVIIASITPDDCLGDNGSVGFEIQSPSGNPSDYKVWLIVGSNPVLNGPNDPVPSGDVKSFTDNPALDVFDMLPTNIYTLVAQEDIAINPALNGCFSAPVTFALTEALPPNLDGFASKTNSNCGAMTLGDGAINIQFSLRPDDPYHPDYQPQPSPPAQFPVLAVSYDVEVLEVNTGGVTMPFGTFSGDPNNEYSGTIPDLRDGTFDVTVKANETGCTTTKTFTVNPQPVVAQLVAGDIEIDNSFKCLPDGAIEVVSIGIIGGGAGILDEYEFRWYANSTDANANVNIITSGQGDINPDLGGDYFDAGALARPAGVYWVVAEKTVGPGTGCLSAPFDGNIQDKSVKPTVNIEPFSNTACTNPNLPPLFEGSLKITVTNSGSLPSPSGFNYDWLEATVNSGLKGTTTAGDGDGVGSGDVPPDDDNPIDLEDGFYKLTAINIETGCTRDAEATIDRTQLPIIISQSTHTDQFICDPDGSVTVIQVLVNNLVAPRSDFEFFWHRGSISTPTVLEGLDEFVLNPGNYNDPINGTVMGAGTFNVVAVRVLSSDGGPGYGCPSPQKTETVLNKSKKPVMAITPFVNTSCSDLTFEGSLQINVTDEGSAPAGALGYQYTWTQSPPGSPLGNTNGNNANGIDDGDQDNPTMLIDGTYKLIAKNNTTGCIANEVQAVITPATTPVVIAMKDFVDRFVCAPAGRAFVTQVTVGSLVYDVNSPATTPPFPPEIDFSFYEGFPLADNSNLVLSGIGESQLDSINLPNIKATTYYVVAQNKLGPGLDCKSVEERIDISDRSLVPEFTITPTSNTSCDLTVFDGSLSVVVVNPGSLPATNGYDYTWVATPIASTPPSSNPLDPTDNMDGDGAGVDGDNPTGLKDGTYTLNIVNTNTQCISKNATATIGIEGRPNVTLSLSKMDKQFCLPSGKVIVNSVQVGNTVFDNTQFANFDFEYFEGSAAGQSVLQGNDMGQLDSITYSHPDPLQNIKALTNYFVVATKVSGVGLSCESLPSPIQFNDISNRPIPTLLAFANSTCTGAFLNGAIKILVRDNAGPGVGSLYNYEYFYDDGVNPPVGPTNVLNNNGNGLNDADMDSLMNLPDGSYNFVIRNQITQCTTPAMIVIQYDPVASKPNIVSVDKNFPIDCLGNGGDATVTSIRIGSNPELTGSPTLDPPNFGYDWYDNGTDPFMNPAPPGNVAPVIPNGRMVTMLTAGTYYVTVRDLLTDCKSTPTQVIIDSANIVYPAVLIRQTILQLSCDPADGTAELQATADGQDSSNGGYTFTWYNSLDGTGTTVIDPWPGSQSTITDLTSGNYSVTALNSTTGCETTKLFIIPPFDPKFFPKIVTSGDPQSSCLVPNGSVVVRVIPFPVVNGLTYDPPYNFTIDLYNGDQTNNGLNQEPPLIPPDISNLPPIAGSAPPGTFIADPLDDGTYTVRLLDNETGCITVEKATVIDDRRRPIPKIVIENPLTNCDTRFNGQLSASADNRSMTHYNFFWWSEVTPSDTITRNDKLIGQDQGKYFVSIVNKVSGCDTLTSEVIPVNQVLPQAPSITLIQPQTICWEDFYPQEPLARPNGWLQASVGGQTAGFRFEWFEGELTNQQVAGLTPDTIGVNNLHLISQMYTVKGVILATGCSNVASLLVPDNRIIPTGRVDTTPSFCEDARQPSGSVILQQTNTENVSLREIIWYNDETNAYVGDGIQVFQLPPGFYRAEFLSNEFCYNEAVGKIETEILAYNLVSSNSDGSNDVWIIDCISNFTIAGGAARDNNVKIFNRYGVKVYEADGYNNNDIVFRGVGENGIYALRDQLPDGTYFYVIDKRNGSKPITGFLELVR